MHTLILHVVYYACIFLLVVIYTCINTLPYDNQVNTVVVVIYLLTPL